MRLIYSPFIIHLLFLYIDLKVHYAVIHHPAPFCALKALCVKMCLMKDLICF